MYNFAATWSIDHGAQVRQLTQNEVLRMADNATSAISAPLDSMIKLKEAAERLRESIRGAPSIQLRLFAPMEQEVTNLMAQEPWPLQEVYASIPAREPEVLLSTMWVPVEKTRWVHGPANAHNYVQMTLSAEFSSISPASTGSHASTYHEIVSAISAPICTVMKQGHPATPDELVSQCVGAIMESRLLAGQAKLRSVKVSLGCDSISSKPTASIHPSSKHIVSAKGSAQGRAIIALSSNLGDRVANIEAACKLINDDPDLQLRNTSPLYETRPMYYEDQGTFVNGVCSVS